MHDAREAPKLEGLVTELRSIDVCRAMLDDFVNEEERLQDCALADVVRTEEQRHWGKVDTHTRRSP